MQIVILATWLGVVLQAAGAPLTQAVTDYWRAVEAQDFVSALPTIHPEDRNHFIRQPHPTFRNWSLVEIKKLSDVEARVRVQVEQFLEPTGHYYTAMVIQRWVQSEGHWQLRVVRLDGDLLNAVYGSGPKSLDEPDLPVLAVLPEVVKFPFLNPSSRGWFLIRNGLEVPARVIGMEFEEDKFRVIQGPEIIEGKTNARVRLEYIGAETDKDLTSSLVLKLEQSGEESVYSLTLLYNHVDAATRAIFGLSDEDVKNLKKGDKLRPVLGGALPPAKTKPPGVQDLAPNPSP